MNYTQGDRVDLFIVRATQLGYVVLIDNEVEGLLFKSDVFQPLQKGDQVKGCLLYTSPSPRDLSTSRMPSSA